MKYSKIINNETLKFGGKTYRRAYHPESFVQDKESVHKDVLLSRAYGFSARAVKRPDGWAVFLRRKT